MNGINNFPQNSVYFKGVQKSPKEEGNKEGAKGVETGANPASGQPSAPVEADALELIAEMNKGIFHVIDNPEGGTEPPRSGGEVTFDDLVAQLEEFPDEPSLEKLQVISDIFNHEGCPDDGKLDYITLFNDQLEAFLSANEGVSFSEDELGTLESFLQTIQDGIEWVNSHTRPGRVTVLVGKLTANYERIQGILEAAQSGNTQPDPEPEPWVSPYDGKSLSELMAIFRYGTGLQNLQLAEQIDLLNHIMTSEGFDSLPENQVNNILNAFTIRLRQYINNIEDINALSSDDLARFRSFEDGLTIVLNDDNFHAMNTQSRFFFYEKLTNCDNIEYEDRMGYAQKYIEGKFARYPNLIRPEDIEDPIARIQQIRNYMNHASGFEVLYWQAQLSDVLTNASELFDPETLTADEIGWLGGKYISMDIPDEPQEHVVLCLTAQLAMLNFLLTCNNILEPQRPRIEAKIAEIEARLSELTQ